MPSSMPITLCPSKSFKQLATITSSLILVLVSASLMNFLDRLILARHSLESLEVCTAALSLGAAFQFPLIRLAVMTQVLIGQYEGANDYRLMGPLIWQMIWFFLMTMGITLPLGWIIGPLFFANSPVAAAGINYFHYLMTINFLFPIGATLSAFYLGRKKTKMVLLASISSQIIHIGLDFPLIFGIRGILPSLGALGSVIATAIAELGFCIFLLLDFLKTNNRITFGTEKYRLNGPLLRTSLKLGIPRTIAIGLSFIAWAAVSQIMIEKGGDHLAVLALGGSILTLFTCIHTGLLQGVSILAANLIGSKSPFSILKLCKPAFMYLILTSAFFVFPCLVYPDFFICLFFKEEISPQLAPLLRHSCLWIWLYFISYGMFAISVGFLNAWGEVLFQMLYVLCLGGWITYIPVLIGIGMWGWRPDILWLLMALTNFIPTVIYFLRLKHKLDESSPKAFKILRRLRILKRI